MERLYIKAIMGISQNSYKGLFKTIGIIGFIFLLNACAKPEVEMLKLYVGTYTRTEGHVDGKAKGIYVLDFNPATGDLKLAETIDDIINPSYLSLHPNNRYLYAVSEQWEDGRNAGEIKSIRLSDQEAEAMYLSTVNAEGNAPCYISMNQNLNYVLVANYSGTIASFPINEDYSVGPSVDIVKHTGSVEGSPRQDAAHPHMIAVDKNDRLYVADLGTNHLVRYHLEDGRFKRQSTYGAQPFAGPRHFVLDESRNQLYLLNELLNTIEVIDVADKNFMTMKQSIACWEPKERIGSVTSAAIKLHPNNQFLYTSNRGLNGSEEQSISAFKIDDQGQLQLIEVQQVKGKIPRDFAISPDGKFLLVALQDSGTIELYHINQSDGSLSFADKNFKVPTPVCLVFQNPENTSLEDSRDRM